MTEKTEIPLLYVSGDTFVSLRGLRERLKQDYDAFHQKIEDHEAEGIPGMAERARGACSALHHVIQVVDAWEISTRGDLRVKISELAQLTDQLRTIVTTPIEGEPT